MRRWGSRSLDVRATLDPRLRKWCDRVLHEVADISLIYGYRDRELQNTLYENGLSTLKYPDSKHNKRPAKAVDLQPYPRPGNDIKLAGALGWIAGRGQLIADELGINLAGS